MKTQLIIIKKHLMLMCDEAMKENDTAIALDTHTLFRCNEKELKPIVRFPNLYRKVIAGGEDLPAIDDRSLSPEETERIGHILWASYWEQAARQLEEGVNPMSFRLGFKIAQGINEFTRKDMEKAFIAGGKLAMDFQHADSFDEFMDNLSIKLFDVEIEMTEDGKPKITNNSIKITKVL